MSPKSANSALGLGFAVAAGAALAQLGLAYGFGLLSWADAAPGSADPVLDHRWNANLAWVAWFSAASCVVGGLASGVVGGRGSASGSAVRLGAVFAAAVGAFAVGPLVALSAEQNAVSSSFPTEPLIAAGVGAAVGFVLTLIGLSSRSVAVNVGASVALLWLFAILARFTDIGDPATPGSSVIELAVWGSWASPDSMLGRRGFAIAVPFVIGSALIGAVVAVMARRGPITNSGYRIAAASGIAGPLIVTAAHLVAGHETMPIMLVGPYAAIAGLLGSLIVSAIPRAGGQIDDTPDGRSDRTDDALVETAPGWTVPEAPGSAYSDTKRGDTKDLPAKETADAPADPDVDWVQELKPVGEGGTLTADADPKAKPESKTKPESKAKPKRPRKTAKRTRRKLTDAESDSNDADENP